LVTTCVLEYCFELVVGGRVGGRDVGSAAEGNVSDDCCSKASLTLAIDVCSWAAQFA
jgi:hypothetical protein